MTSFNAYVDITLVDLEADEIFLLYEGNSSFQDAGSAQSVSQNISAMAVTINWKSVTLNNAEGSAEMIFAPSNTTLVNGSDDSSWFSKTALYTVGPINSNDLSSYATLLGVSVDSFHDYRMDINSVLADGTVDFTYNLGNVLDIGPNLMIGSGAGGIFDTVID